jgi:biopolymer transport protein ExbD
VRFARRVQATSGAPLAPLLDVVLLLLIFFVVTTSFAESQMALDLPAAEAAGPADHSALAIEIDAVGAISIAGEPASLDVLARRLEEAEAVARPIEIRADRLSKHEYFVTVLDLARQKGVEAIGITVDAGSRSIADQPSGR